MPETINNAVVFITCPGGSNVSLMSYKAASVLEQDGCGKFVKLAGDKFKERDLQRVADAAKYAKKWVLIEGCTKGCGKAILDEAGINPDEHLVVTDIGIERENKTNYSKEELDRVLTAVKATL